MRTRSPFALAAPHQIFLPQRRRHRLHIVRGVDPQLRLAQHFRRNVRGQNLEPESRHALSAYSLSTIASVYGSSPDEHPALHTSSGRPLGARRQFRQRSLRQIIEVLRLPKEIRLVRRHHVDKGDFLLPQALLPEQVIAIQPVGADVQLTQPAASAGPPASFSSPARDISRPPSRQKRRALQNPGPTAFPHVCS